MNKENNESDESMEALFEEAALILSDKEESTPPMAGKTPTTHNYGAALATAVDGGRGDLCIDGTPSQGLHVVFPNAPFKF